MDESGDPGFKLTRGSTSHFVVAMVIFDKNEDAEQTSEVIKKGLTDLKIKPEFKFSKSRDGIRDEFFNRIKSCKFRVRALVVDKKKIYSPNLRENDEKFYNYFVKQLINFEEIKLNNATIKIDGSGDREFKKELHRYLRSQIKPSLTFKVKFVDSQKDALIQLADMVAGAIYRSYPNESREVNKIWRKAIADKIDNVWDFK
ncbi:MAG: hypothetical protein BVN34_08465 [Proteobacteria bacterium ST_bin12]|nr:MAG: hypothetical protein BVN34_08465 [Proteobacteria bacterium ST_bin12]